MQRLLIYLGLLGTLGSPPGLNTEGATWETPGLRSPSPHFLDSPASGLYGGLQSQLRSSQEAFPWHGSACRGGESEPTTRDFARASPPNYCGPMPWIGPEG